MIEEKKVSGASGDQANPKQRHESVPRKKTSPRLSAAQELDEAKHFVKGKEGEIYRFPAEEAIREAAQRDMMGVLDSRQQREFRELLGADLDVSRLHVRKGPPPKKPPQENTKE